MSGAKVPLSTLTTFGDLLKFLRRRAQLSQRDLAIAVGYSESQISRLETNQRPPDPTSILALFTPALGIEAEPEITDRLLALAKVSRTLLSTPKDHEDVEGLKNPFVPSALPTGIITFLFTDIEGSTPLWESMPKAMKASVAQHHTILREAIEGKGGKIFQVIGDAFQASFIDPQQALAAALLAQHQLQEASWGETGPIKVRMGLHTGPAEADSSTPGYYAVSHTLNRVARVMSVGSGGQILLSEETANLVKRSLPKEIWLKDLGEHRLKGMERLEHIYQVVANDLPEHFPPIASQQALRNHLPGQLTSFVGRKDELSELIDLLRSSKTRLVTLTGEGGCGKTRLALRAGEDLAQEYEHGAWLVELAPLVNPQFIIKAISEVFGLPNSGEDQKAGLIQFLQPKKTLLILDNCEHLIEETAQIVDVLLRSCPKLVILATSRETLELSGEVIFRVLPLTLPPTQIGAALILEEIECFDAIRLFTERAQGALRTFELNSQNATAVARICQRLDGIPLAIELAAARVAILHPAQIASRLDADFALLSGSRRGGLPHHQTIQTAIDWSYNLLSEIERVLLRRLAVFSGGWSLEAAEAVTASQPIDRRQVLELLTSLVNKSLVAVDYMEVGEARYRILETVRSRMREKLVESSEQAQVYGRHLAYYVDLVEATEPHLTERSQSGWLDKLEQENDNLRLALAWSLESKQAEAGLRLAGALWRYWWITGRMVEGIRWCEAVLAMTDAILDSGLSARKARALLAHGFLLSITFEEEKALKVLTASLELYHELNDVQGSGAALCMLGVNQIDTQKAFEYFEEGLRYSYQAEDGWWIAFNKH
jgi:predicted ATPase/class 3 adenylate cyclase